MRNRIYKRIAHFIYAHDIALLVGVVLLSLLSVIAVRKLPLQGDLARLLPEDQPSVVALKQVVKMLGGAGQLLILATPPDPVTGELFVEALDARGEGRAFDFEPEVAQPEIEERLVGLPNPGGLRCGRARVRHGGSLAARPSGV